MSGRRLRFVLVLALLALPASAASAGAFSRPDLDFSLGHSFGADGTPSGGGFAVALAPMWPAGDHARFGVSLFADDVGTTLVELFDKNSGADLGTVATLHRWTWGAAWRGDWTLVQHPHWQSAVRTEWGWWRVEDDVRGSIQQAVSAVGVGVGIDARRRFSAGHMVGLDVGYRQLFDAHDSDGRHPWHYVTAGLEWSWSARSHS